MTCELAHNDGAYVLGALSAADRAAYERHLTTCAECSRAVREIAGLPGLLARVPSDVLEGPPPSPEPVPDTLLPGLVDEVRRATRRRTWLVAGAAAASLVAVAGASVAVTTALHDDAAAPGPTAAVPLDAPHEMAPVGDPGMTASVAVTSVPWGTRLDLTCSYDDSTGTWWEPGVPGYALVVRTRDGRRFQVATWRPLPGRTMSLTAATAAAKTNIRWVEIRSSDGAPLLRLQEPGPGPAPTGGVQG